MINVLTCTKENRFCTEIKIGDKKEIGERFECHKRLNIKIEDKY